MKFIKKLLKRNHYPLADSQKEYVFTSGGTPYYRFTDFNNIPALRGMKLCVYFEEMKHKITGDYIDKHTSAMENILLSNPVNVYEIKKLNDQMKERRKMSVDTDQLMKIASVVFFDKSEDLSDYDFGYNKRKIENWKKHDADTFFLFKPMRELFPFLQDTDENFRKYSVVVQQLNQLHLENLSKHLQR